MVVDEQGLQMPVVEVFGDILRHRRLAGLQRVEVAPAQLRRDLVADVEELPQMRVECRVARDVPQRGDELLRASSFPPWRGTAAWLRSMSITAA